MFLVFFFRLREHENIIEKDSCKSSMWLKNAVHHQVKCGWSICEAKRHQLVCKTLLGSNEGTFELIFFNNPNLEVVGVAITHCVALVSCDFI